MQFLKYDESTTTMAEKAIPRTGIFRYKGRRGTLRTVQRASIRESNATACTGTYVSGCCKV
jgi:hypothetical protein